MRIHKKFEAILTFREHQASCPNMCKRRQTYRVIVLIRQTEPLKAIFWPSS